MLLIAVAAIPCRLDVMTFTAFLAGRNELIRTVMAAARNWAAGAGSLASGAMAEDDPHDAARRPVPPLETDGRQ